jgi:hypothetical protein
MRGVARGRGAVALHTTTNVQRLRPADTERTRQSGKTMMTVRFSTAC